MLSIENRKGNRKTYPVIRKCLWLLFMLSFFLQQRNFGQLFPESIRNRQYEDHLQEFNSPKLQSKSFPSDNIWNEQGDISIQTTDKAESGSFAMLDSMQEFQNFGYYNELYRWYYHYNIEQKVDSVWRFYYNSEGEFEKITEIRTFNSDGQILRLVKRQPDFQLWQWYGDTTIIEYYTEDYTYQRGNLIRKIITNNYQGYHSTNQEYHTYDSENRLIRDSLIGSDGYLPNVTAYTYNPDNDLEYELYLFEGIVYGVNKYEYEKTDTSKLTTHHWIYYPSLTENPIPDTITHWQGEHYYYETFDQLGRRITIRVEYYNIYEGASIYYRSDLNYTDNSDLLHASYYDWIDKPDSGYWQESMRIDNTYDEDENLVLYEKTFYDERSGSWAPDNSKTYYYTDVPLDLPTPSGNPEKLVLFPNPAEDVLCIKADVSENADYSIYTQTGICVKKGRLTSHSLDISHLKSGIYILKLWDGTSISSEKFIKY
jgi:hypothetical protein